MPPDEVVEFLATADVGVHPLLAGIPNHEMALPNKLFEYVHAGLPIVVTDLRELGSFVRKHGLGEAFRSGDPADMAAGVEKGARQPGALPPGRLGSGASNRILVGTPG